MQRVYKVGDSRPVIEDVLERDGEIIRLHGTDRVRLLLRDPDGAVFINDVATVARARKGQVRYHMDGGFPTAGTYVGEWVIEWEDGGTQTVPAASEDAVSIEVNQPEVDRTVDPRAYDDPDIHLTNTYTDTLQPNTGTAVSMAGSDLEDVGSLTVGGMGSDYHWELVESIDVGDTTTPVDVTFSSIPVSTYLRLVAEFRVAQGGDGTIYCQCNGVTTANYNWITRDGTATADDTAFQIGLFPGGGTEYAHSTVIYAGSDRNWSFNSNPYTATVGSGIAGETNRIDAGAVNSLRYFSEGDYVGTVKLYRRL